MIRLILALSACRPEPRDPRSEDPLDPTEQTPPVFARAVVLDEQPLSLSNPQEERVVWPLWGGAFTAHEEVSLSVSLEAGAASAGLVLAGPGTRRQRRAVELVGGEGGWVLRETRGDDLLQEQALEGAGPFLLELAAGAGSLRLQGPDDEIELSLSEPLSDGQADLDSALGLYVALEPEAELTLGEVSMTQPLPVEASLGTPLRELAAARDLRVGSAVDIWPPLHDLGFESLMAQQFDLCAPTEFYWPTTRGEDPDWFFLPADLTVNYALVHDQRVTGMFLLWDFELPWWVSDLAYAEGSEALGRALDEHIATLVSRYRGKVDAWVVVNEAIWGPGDAGNDEAQYAETLWSDWLGVEHIENAFYVARQADPSAVLLYNETGAEGMNGKSDFLYGMVSDFVARGVPIDGVGLQFHVHAASPPSMEDVRANMERLGALGLEVYITELDVSLEGMTGSEQERLELQARIYADILEVCLEVEACHSYTVFGFSDRYAWDELGDATPLLFDDRYVAKPAFYALQTALQ